VDGVCAHHGTHASGGDSADASTLSVLGGLALGSRDSLVTIEKYRAIRAGMTYEDVERALGREGIEFSRSEQAGYALITYQWDNADGSYVQITLSHGVVTTKTQFGLSR
jgi:hypothetical protein